MPTSMPPAHPASPPPVDAALLQAGRRWLMETYGQDADLFSGPGGEAERLAQSTARVAPAVRQALQAWFDAARQGPEADAEQLLRQQLGLEFAPAGWQHPAGLPRRGARELLRYLGEALAAAEARP